MDYNGWSIILAMLETNEGHLLLNRYQLLEQFASGGMAEIYRARDIDARPLCGDQGFARGSSQTP